MTLAGLALRELWISFRLLLVVGVILLSALPIAVLPHVRIPNLIAPPDLLSWFSIALAVALAAVAGVAAWTLAVERRRGAAGWLVVRAVPRPTVLLAWFTAFALLSALGLLPAAGLGWVALGDTLAQVGPGPFAAAVGAAGCAGLAAIALGLLAGSLLGPLPATSATVLAAGALLLAAALGAGGWLAEPAGGLRVLAGLDGAGRPVAESARAAGTALGLTGGLLVLGAAAIGRADL